MSYINNKQIGEIIPISDNIIEVTGLLQSTSGFIFYLDNNIAVGNYDDFTTIYKTIDETTIQYSNDGTIYVEPPTPPPPTEEEKKKEFELFKESKVNEMNQIQQATIINGFEIKLSVGVERFSLSEKNQTSLSGLQMQVMAGADKLPWHCDDEASPCKFYSNTDMNLITTKALQFVAYNVTYFRDLRRYIRSLTTVDEVNAITYGMAIPTEYQSEVLKSFLNA